MLFSIVMPTRNRADLLRYSLQSALAQTFDDYEIVISDNFSSDDTLQVAKHFSCGRLRYIRTNEALPMPESWEFALSHARGDYILYLCDDDALRPDLLQFLYRVINKQQLECVSWMNGIYYHPDWDEEKSRNLLILENYGHRLVELKSSDLLKDLFDMKLRKVEVPLPKMLNSCCSRSILRQIKGELGAVFLPQSPDYSVAVSILAAIPKYLFIESPMFLGGISRKTIGANANRRNEAVKSFYNDFKREAELFLHAPLTAKICSNSIAESFLRVKAAMPKKLEKYNLSLVSYFIECRKDIENTKSHGNDVTAELEEFYMVLDQQDSKVKRAVLESIELSVRQTAEPPKNLKSILRKIKNRLFRIKPMEETNLPKGVIYGSENGFSNIDECAVKLSEIYPLPEIY